MVDSYNHLFVKSYRYFVKFYWTVNKMNLLDYIFKKEKDMNKEELIAQSQASDGVTEDIKPLEDNGGVVDIEEMAKKVHIHPYFGMDSVSGDLISFFNAANPKAAVRSFCNSLDMVPLNVMRDFVLVDGVTREIVFEARDYVEQWKSNQAFRLENMIRNYKNGVANA